MTEEANGTVRDYAFSWIPSRVTVRRSSLCVLIQWAVNLLLAPSIIQLQYGTLPQEGQTHCYFNVCIASLMCVMCCHFTALYTIESLLPSVFVRRVHTLIGHSGEISNVQFNWDCSLIVTGSMDKTCKVSVPAHRLTVNLHFHTSVCLLFGCLK